MEFGNTLILEGTGDKAAETLDELVALFESNFEESASPTPVDAGQPC